MATIDLGKIKFNWRGTYNAGTAYVPDDVVQYADGSVTGSVNVSVTRTLYDIPNHTVTITPSNASNKILISFSLSGETSADNHTFSFVIKRTISGGATTYIQGDVQSASNKSPLLTQNTHAYDISDEDTTMEFGHCSNYLDSPNTTSAVTYQIQIQCQEGGTGVYYYNRTVRDDNNYHSERGLSWITAMEVASGVL